MCAFYLVPHVSHFVLFAGHSAVSNSLLAVVPRFCLIFLSTGRQSLHSKGVHVYNFGKYCQEVFQSNCTNLPSWQKCMRLWIAPCQPCYYQSFSFQHLPWVFSCNAFWFEILFHWWLMRLQAFSYIFSIAHLSNISSYWSLKYPKCQSTVKWDLSSLASLSAFLALISVNFFSFSFWELILISI